MINIRNNEKKCEIFTDNEANSSEYAEYLPSIDRLQNNKYIKQLKKELTMEQKPIIYGLKETKEFLDFIIELANTTNKVLEDGKFDWLEVTSYFSAITKLPKAFEGLELIPKELDDMSKEEKAELIQYVNQKLMFHEKTEAIVEYSLELAYNLYQIIKLIKK